MALHLVLHIKQFMVSKLMWVDIVGIFSLALRIAHVYKYNSVSIVGIKNEHIRVIGKIVSQLCQKVIKKLPKWLNKREIVIGGHLDLNYIGTQSKLCFTKIALLQKPYILTFMYICIYIYNEKMEFFYKKKQLTSLIVLHFHFGIFYYYFYWYLLYITLK